MNSFSKLNIGESDGDSTPPDLNPTYRGGGLNPKNILIKYKKRVCTMINERQQQILSLLEAKGEVQLNQLRDIFPELSIMTLRRDLVSLESAGHLIRTHGGAVSVKKITSTGGEEDAYSLRATENIEAKMKIAQKALSFVEKRLPSISAKSQALSSS